MGPKDWTCAPNRRRVSTPKAPVPCPCLIHGKSKAWYVGPKAGHVPPPRTCVNPKGTCPLPMLDPWEIKSLVCGAQWLDMCPLARACVNLKGTCPLPMFDPWEIESKALFHTIIGQSPGPHSSRSEGGIPFPTIGLSEGGACSQPTNQPKPTNHRQKPTNQRTQANHQPAKPT